MAEEFNDSNVLDRYQRASEANAKGRAQHKVGATHTLHPPPLGQGLFQCDHGSALPHGHPEIHRDFS